MNGSICKEWVVTMFQPLEHMLSTVMKTQQNSYCSYINENTEVINVIEKIRKQKYDVLHGYITPNEADLVRPQIVESWIRSYDLGLDLFKPNPAPELDQADFAEILQEKELLLKTARSYILQLKNMMYGSNCIIILTDEKGVILEVVEAEDTIMNEDYHMKPGEVWNESTVGTCSHDLCIRMESPIQICGPEHYCEGFKYTIASSAPIFDENDNLIGTLNIASQDYCGQNAHTLGLAVSMCWAIQNELRSKDNNELIHATLEGYRDAVITINKKKIITKYNKLAESFLSLNKQNFAERRIEEVMGFQPKIDFVLNTGEPVVGADIIINKSMHKYVLHSIQPIKNSHQFVTGCVLNLCTYPQGKKDAAHVENSENQRATVTFDHIVGSSPQIINTINSTRKFALIGANILIEGESGTGKELFAQAIHSQTRPNSPFMVLNCAAIPKNLIESELFGYEGGAFTGAERQGKPGKIELANNGTLFLDEIGDMPLEIQPVLLRVLEDRTIMRVGGSKYIPIDFNLVAATNKDLLDLVRRGLFREDLFYRLAVFRIKIPPLRERKVDIVKLAIHFVEKAATYQTIPVPLLSENTKDILVKYGWPGNVRQLENAMVYAVNMCSGGKILPDDLPGQIKDSFESAFDDFSGPKGEENVKKDSDFSLQEMERIAIMQALQQTSDNIGKAAKILGLSKSTLYRRIRKYNIKIDVKQ
ncbi:sigma 54-interacting transcriptional regulator [Dehalobacter sp. DCM]|uniref:sigma-54-dependent Fis family transcriptional regulator n=1 Tax=Dehalobacter sp. DCM TaxID=2907827 RepID=UPI003081AADF|nr:sigma 54-interacting transcriptional regulator [Dehalobacter sp. DCM]